MNSNESPLYTALSKRSKFQMHGPFKLPDPPRILDLKTSELPDLEDATIGEEVEGCFKARIKSIHDDGRVVVEISEITPEGDSDEEEAESEGEAENEKPQVINVRSDTSPVPS